MNTARWLIIFVFCVCFQLSLASGETESKPMKGQLAVIEVTGVYMGIPVKITGLEIEVKYSMWALLSEPILRYAVKYKFTNETVIHLFMGSEVTQLLWNIKNSGSYGGGDMAITSKTIPLSTIRLTELSSGYISFRRSTFGSTNGFWMTDWDSSIWGTSQKKTMSFPGAYEWDKLFDRRGYPYLNFLGRWLSNTIIDPYPMPNKQKFMPKTRDYLSEDEAKRTWKALDSALQSGRVEQVFDECRVYPVINLSAVFSALREKNEHYREILDSVNRRSAEVDSIYLAFENVLKTEPLSTSKINRVQSIARKYKESFQNELSQDDVNKLGTIIGSSNWVGFYTKLNEFVESNQNVFAQENSYEVLSDELVSMDELALRIPQNLEVSERWRRLRQALVGNALRTGDVQVTLTWSGDSDVDLYVKCPHGEIISYRKKSSQCGGEQDVDDTDGYGPENIYWSESDADFGVYEIDVKLFSGGATNWSVRVLVDGKVSEYSGVLLEKKQKVFVHRFERQ